MSAVPASLYRLRTSTPPLGEGRVVVVVVSCTSIVCTAVNLSIVVNIASDPKGSRRWKDPSDERAGGVFVWVVLELPR